jgi:hypothetical protein
MDPQEAGSEQTLAGRRCTSLAYRKDLPWFGATNVEHLGGVQETSRDCSESLQIHEE